jgi:fused signal recognition particle receptor
VGIFDKIKSGLSRTRDQLTTRIEWVVKGKPIDEDAFDEIEEAILLADTGVETAALLMDALKERWRRGYIKTPEDIKRSLAEEVEKILSPVAKPLMVGQNKPFVILTLGVNGVGKTTTIAKIANICRESGNIVLLGACDTFRADKTRRRFGSGGSCL